MFGPRYFGPRHFGPRYWGNGSDTPPPEPEVSDVELVHGVARAINVFGVAAGCMGKG